MRFNRTDLFHNLLSSVQSCFLTGPIRYRLLFVNFAESQALTWSPYPAKIYGRYGAPYHVLAPMLIL